MSNFFIYFCLLQNLMFCEVLRAPCRLRRLLGRSLRAVRFLRSLLRLVFLVTALELQNESPNTRVRVVLDEFRVRLFGLFDDFLAVLLFRGIARLLR